MIYRWEKGTTYGEKYPAHTYIVGSNRHHADDETGWEWTNSNRNELKKFQEVEQDIMRLYQ